LQKQIYCMTSSDLLDFLISFDGRRSLRSLNQHARTRIWESCAEPGEHVKLIAEWVNPLDI
jgi:hypothetical protein